MIEIAIVEDEENYREVLCDYLNKFQKESGEQIHLSVFTDGDEIVENYSAVYDVILMDIEMRFMNGMTAAKKIREADKGVVIIFITNMAQYAIQGYAVDALDYVLKPISYFAFSQTISRAIGRIKKREEHYINIISKNGVDKVPVSQIGWIESEGHRLIYYSSDRVYESTVNSMKELEKELSDYHFFRCNKGYLVNLAHVRAIRDGWAILLNGQVMISRAKRSEFQKALIEYAGDTIR